MKIIGFLFLNTALFFGLKGYNSSVAHEEYELNMKDWADDFPEVVATVVDTASMVQLDANRYGSSLAFQYNLRIRFDNGREVTEVFTDPFEYKKHPIGSNYVVKITEYNYRHYGVVPPFTKPENSIGYLLGFLFLIFGVLFIVLS